MNLPWTYHINNKPDMKLTFSLFPTILDVDFTAPLEKKNFPSSSKLGTHLTPTFTQRIMGRKSFFNSSPPEWNGRCFDSKVWQCFTELFDYLPIAASVRRLELPPIRGVVSLFFYSEVLVKWRGLPGCFVGQVAVEMFKIYQLMWERNIWKKWTWGSTKIQQYSRNSGLSVN